MKIPNNCYLPPLYPRTKPHELRNKAPEDEETFMSYLVNNVCWRCGNTALCCSLCRRCCDTRPRWESL
jgi:hypothetical protein